MEILDPNQRTILERVRARHHLGDVPLEVLRTEVELLLELRLIEPSGACPYRLTSSGARMLELATAARIPSQRR